MKAAGKITLKGLKSRNVTLSISADIDGIADQIQYTFKFRKLDDESRDLVTSLVEQALKMIEEVGVVLKRTPFSLTFGSIGDMAAIMQILLWLCNELGEYGLSKAVAVGDDSKARKAKDIRKTKEK